MRSFGINFAADKENCKSGKPFLDRPLIVGDLACYLTARLHRRLAPSLSLSGTLGPGARQLVLSDSSEAAKQLELGRISCSFLGRIHNDEHDYVVHATLVL